MDFLPNDPLAAAFAPLRRITPHRDRPDGRAGFDYVGAVPEGVYMPGSSGFVFWQCREAALRALDAWEAMAGPLASWSDEAEDPRRLRLASNAGVRLNASYDRASLSFFSYTTDGHTTWAGASTDVVAHETGHACLDALRPDLFGSPFTESAAFHEAFGDCLAVLVALRDRETRLALLEASPDLGTPNFVEATAEDLADGVRRAFGPTHPAAAPRHALNRFVHRLPTSLPTTGPPDALTAEIHSFGRIFTGCVYDLVRALFAAAPRPDADALLDAATTVGRLLVAGARDAQDSPRFFASVGRAMRLADAQASQGAHRDAIERAFAGHGIQLAGTDPLTPTVELAGAAPALAPGADARLAPSTMKDLRRRLDAVPGARVSTSLVSLGAVRLVEAVHHRAVDLSSLGAGFRGVVAMAPEPVLVGVAGDGAAALGPLPDPSTTTGEVLKFVETLLEHERIALAPSHRPETARVHRGAVALADTDAPWPTHVVRARGKRRVLARVRFCCGGGAGAQRCARTRRRRPVPDGDGTIS